MIIKYFIVLLVFFLQTSRMVHAQQCNGSATDSYVYYDCPYSLLRGGFYCNEHTSTVRQNCGFLAGYGYCARFTTQDGTCTGGGPWSACSITAPSFSGSTTTNDCNTCTDNGVRNWGECSATCGGGIQVAYDNCGEYHEQACNTQPCCSTVYGTWNSTCNLGCSRTCNGGSCPPNDCSNVTMPSCAVNGTWSSWDPSDCAISCGQTVTRSCSAVCGGVCPNDGYSDSKVCSSSDAGAAGKVTLNAPNASSIATAEVVTDPATLRWYNNETNHAYTDGYEYRVYSTTGDRWIVGGGTAIRDFSIYPFNRCSTFYSNQRVYCDNVACTGEVVRAFDATCPVVGLANECRRCSTVNNNEYVWWMDINPTNGCDTPSAAETVERGYNADCSVSGGSDGVRVSGGASQTSVLASSLESGNIYYWQSRAVNDTCVGNPAGIVYGTWSNPGYFRINRPPTIEAVAISNGSGSVVPVQTGDRNHICQMTFQNDPNPRRVTFTLRLRDLDGWNEIQSATMRWNGRTYPLTLNPGLGTDRMGTVTVDFGAGDNSSGVYSLEGIVADNYSSGGYVDLGRSWKVWDCNVPTSGTVYDGSPIISCPLVGFDNPAPVEMNFTSLNFGGVAMSVSPPSSYGPNNLIWGHSYAITYPGINASGMNYRINGSNCNSLALVTLDQLRVDAYLANPAADIDFSFVRNQVGWFQARGSGIEAGNSVSSAVPVTCMLPVCTPALVVSNVGVSDDGAVAAPTYNITSGCSDCDRGYPRDIYINRDIMYDSVSYESIKSSYWGRLGLGTTLNGDQTLAQVIAAKQADGVVFVNGNLNVNSNNSLASGQFLMVVVSGTITIDSSVTDVAGVFVSNRGIVASGNSASALNISGILYTLQNITFNRAFSNGSDNNEAPAVVVNFRPDFVFNMPVALTRAISLRY